MGTGHRVDIVRMALDTWNTDKRVKKLIKQ